MFKYPARTIPRPVEIQGIGLHSGEATGVRLAPLPAGEGLWLVRGDTRIPVHIDHATSPRGSTCFPGVVNTPEHLLAAVIGIGITDLQIECRGAEIPFLDGCAAAWVNHLGQPIETGSTQGRRVTQSVRVDGHGGWAELHPADRLSLEVQVDFGPGLRGAFKLQPTPHDFRRQLMWARTFLPHRMLDAYLDAGLGKGATSGTVILWGERGPLVPVRSGDEPIRHKALDLLGDLALVGTPLLGRVVVHRGTHALHHALIRTFLDGL